MGLAKTIGGFGDRLLLEFPVWVFVDETFEQVGVKKWPDSAEALVLQSVNELVRDEFWCHASPADEDTVAVADSAGEGATLPWEDSIDL